MAYQKKSRKRRSVPRRANGRRLTKARTPDQNFAKWKRGQARKAAKRSRNRLGGLHIMESVRPSFGGGSSGGGRGGTWGNRPTSKPRPRAKAKGAAKARAKAPAKTKVAPYRPLRNISGQRPLYTRGMPIRVDYSHQIRPSAFGGSKRRLRRR